MDLSNSLVCTSIFLIIIPTLLFYFKYKFAYWKKRNVPHFQPSIPLGNISLSFNGRHGQDVADMYRKFKKIDAKYGGFYMSVKPVFLLIDPGIIRTVLTKDFDSFDDRGLYVNEEKEPITAHIFALTGQKWRKLRAKMTPTISTGKIKLMYETILKCVVNLETSLTSICKTNKPIDIRDVCRRFTADVIVSVAFGIEPNSSEGTTAAFLKHGKLMLDNSFLESLKVLLGFTWPNALRLFNWKFIKPEVADFFTTISRDIVEYRESYRVERNDLVNLLMRLLNKKHIDDGKTAISSDESITMNELMAQCFLFFMAGFETSATTMQYCMFELAQHIDMQQKLRDEILSVTKKYNGAFTYDALSEMIYLDKIISETMRKYPPLVILNRKCTKDFVIPETNVTIERGTPVFIPVYGIHHDPEYYPEPNKFDPERFAEDEKRKRPAYTYLPFGEGPKNCLGMRFGLIQTKLGIAQLVANYEYSLHPDTKLPLEFKTEAIVLSHLGTIWLQAKKI